MGISINPWNLIYSMKTIDMWDKSIQANLNGAMRVGYKSMDLDFGGGPTLQIRPPLGNSAAQAQIAENYVKAGNTTIDFSQGTIVGDKTWTHAALNGPGFFLTSKIKDTFDPAYVYNPDDFQYTRDGEWYRDPEGYVRTKEGLYVMDGTYIPQAAGGPSVNALPPWNASMFAPWLYRDRIDIRNTKYDLTRDTVVELHVDSTKLVNGTSDIRVGHYTGPLSGPGVWTETPVQMDTTDPLDVKIRFRLANDLAANSININEYYLFSDGPAGPPLADLTVWNDGVSVAPLNSFENFGGSFVPIANEPQTWATLLDVPGDDWRIDFTPLNTTAWKGYRPGSITYQDGVGYQFGGGPLYLDYDAFGNYIVVDGTGTEPTMQVLTGVTQETVELGEFGLQNQGVLSTIVGSDTYTTTTAGLSTVWTNRTGTSLSQTGYPGYWNTLPDVKKTTPGAQGGGEADVSAPLDFANPLLHKDPVLPGSAPNPYVERTTASGQPMGDDGYTLNVHTNSAFPGLPAGWVGGGYGEGRIATTPDLQAANFDFPDPDTDGANWNRIFSGGGLLANNPAQGIANSGTAAFTRALNSYEYGQNNQVLLTGLDGDVGKVNLDVTAFEDDFEVFTTLAPPVGDIPTVAKWTLNNITGAPDAQWRDSNNTANNGVRSAYFGDITGTDYQAFNITTPFQDNFDNDIAFKPQWTLNNIAGAPEGIQWRPSVNTSSSPNTSAYFGNAAGTNYDAQQTVTTTTNTSVFFESFDGTGVGGLPGTFNQVITSGTGVVRWQANNNGSTSAPNSLWFGNLGTGTFEDGTNIVAGYAQSVNIDLSAATAANLTFDHEFTTEGTPFDIKYVEYSTDGGGSWNGLATYNTGGQAWTGSGPLAIPVGSANTRVRFRFDSVDGLVNAMQGWNIDNVNIQADTTTTTTTPIRSAGELISNTINLSGLASATLDLDESWNTEAGTTYDKKEIWISNDNGGSWAMLRPDPAAGVQGWAATPTIAIPGAYLTATTKIKFVFDTVDSALNSTRGWNIDDVVVRGTQPVPARGEMISNTINMTGYTTAFLDYSDTWNTRGSITQDLKEIWYSADNGGSWSLLVGTNPAGTKPWNNNTVALPASALNNPTVKIKFTFDSVDSGQPAGARGWNIDDVRVYGDKAVGPIYPQTWAGGWAGASNLRVGSALMGDPQNLTFTTRETTGFTTVKRYSVDMAGNIIDHFGLDGWANNYGHSGGSSQISNGSQTWTDIDAMSADDNNLFDYVPDPAKNDIVDVILPGTPAGKALRQTTANTTLLASETRIGVDPADPKYLNADIWDDYIAKVDFKPEDITENGSAYIYVRYANNNNWLRLRYDNTGIYLEKNTGGGPVPANGGAGFTTADSKLGFAVNTQKPITFTFEVEGEHIKVSGNANTLFDLRIPDVSNNGRFAVGATRKVMFDNLDIRHYEPQKGLTVPIGLLTPIDATDLVAQINVIQFPDQQGLKYDKDLGGTYFKETPMSGRPYSTPQGQDGAGSVETYSLESSNVSMARQLSHLQSSKTMYDILTKQLAVYADTVDSVLGLFR